jgi:hypothetical protein
MATRFLATIAMVVFLGRPSLGQMSSGGSAESDSPRFPAWALAFNLAGYLVPNDQSYASATFNADKRQFHFGARYNYENHQTGSMWLGYNFEVGDELLLQATPMIGGVVGRTTGIAPGYLASLNWKNLELSTEGEFVFDTQERRSFFYSWMEFTYSPLEWCRMGLVADRTKAYHTNLDIQRGVLIGFSHRRIDFTSTYLMSDGPRRQWFCRSGTAFEVHPTVPSLLGLDNLGALSIGMARHGPASR